MTGWQCCSSLIIYLFVLAVQTSKGTIIYLPFRRIIYGSNQQLSHLYIGNAYSTLILCSLSSSRKSQGAALMATESKPNLEDNYPYFHSCLLHLNMTEEGQRLQMDECTTPLTERLKNGVLLLATTQESLFAELVLATKATLAVATGRLVNRLL